MAQIETRSNQNTIDQENVLFKAKSDLNKMTKWAKYVPAVTVGIFCSILAIFAYQFFIPNSQSTLTFILIAAVLLCTFLLIGYLFSAFLSSKNEIERLEQHTAILHESQQFMQNMLNKQQSIQSDLLARQDLSDRLLRMVRSTAVTTSLEVALEKILDAACTITHAELGSLLLVDSTGKVTNSYLSRRSNSGDESKKLVGQVMRDGLASWIFRTGQAVILNDARNDDRWITLPDAPYEAGSVLGVPINSGTVVTGILTLIHQRKSHFRNDDLELMQDAASQIALALRNAQIFEEQKRMVDRQTSLYDVLQLISQKLSPESVEISSIKKVTELTGWTTAAILRPDETGSFLETRACEGVFAPGTHYKVDLNVESAAGDAFINGKRVEIINTLGLANHIPLHAKTRSEVYVPLQNRGVIEGLLAFGDAKPYAFSDDEVALVESVAEATSLAITNAHLFQETSEQQGRLEALINTSNDGIVMIGQDNDILVINRTAQTLLNLLGEPEDWLGQSIEVLHAQLLNAGFDEFSNAFADQLNTISIKSAEGAELKVEEYDLASRVITVSILPVMSGVEHLGSLCVIRDITEEKLLTRMRDDLTHSIVHDLKNPLWMLDSGLKLLSDTLTSQNALGESETMMLDISAAQVERMLNLVNALLDISRLEDRKIPLSKEIFDIRSPIQEILHLMEPEAFKKQVNITSNFDDLTGLVTVDADKDMISRVIQNLVGNSLKFTPEHGRIQISCHPNRENKQIDVRICDTGPGISSNLTNHIFEKFATGDHDHSGSGLGLAFCKMAIEAHNGAIEVEETSSNGTTFKFTLPLSH